MMEIGQFRRDPLTLLTRTEHTGPVCTVRREVHDLAVSADGRFLATAEADNRILLYDVATGRELKQLEGHESSVTSLAFSSDGTRLVSASHHDLTALVWDLTSVLDEPTEKKAVSPDTVADNDEVAVVAGREVDFAGKPPLQPRPQRADDLAAPVRINAGGAPIDVDGFAAPFVGDFNVDGKNDLLVGQVGYGRLRIYRNVGTSDRPRFDSFEWFKAGGQIAAVPIGCVVGFTPQLIDFNGNGRSDVVTGSFNEAALYLFRRNKDGAFAEAEFLENKHGELKMGRNFPSGNQIPYNATVFVHDWDHDGDGDLLLGKGRYSLALNEGTRERPVFGDAQPLELDGKPISGGIIPPCAVDWDGDGRDDLLGAAKGDIVWYRNVGTRSRPALEYPRILVSRDGWDHSSDRPDNQPARPQSICAADFNGDGRLDLLLGDNYRVERTLTDEKAALLEEARQRSYSIRRECADLMRERPDNETREERIERFRKALKKWQELETLPWAYSGLGDNPKYERHGNVWLYERIAPQE